MATNSASSDGSETNSTQVKARVILQQCLSAKLMVQPETETEKAKYVHVSYTLWKKWFNPLPDDKILDWSKLKQIADNIQNEK